MTKSLKWHLVPFTDIALKAGNVKSANMAALGAYLACKEIIPLKNALKLLPDFLKNNKELIKLNEKAIEEGLKNGKS